MLESYSFFIRSSAGTRVLGQLGLLFAESLALVLRVHLCLKPSLSSPSQHAAGCLCSQGGAPGPASVELALPT